MGLFHSLFRALGRRPGDEGRDDEVSHREVVSLYEEGRYAEATVHARRLLERVRESFGEGRPEYATALSNLAMLLHRQGDLAGAEPLLRRALEVRRDTLGERHPDHATALNNLALVLCDRGDLGEAEPLLRRALEVRRDALGERHPDYAASLGSLASLLHGRGDLEEAEPLLRQALEVRRDALGKRHPNYATALNNLALVLCDRGDRGEAEPLLRQALEIRRDALGERHPDYAATVDHLTRLLRGLGRTEDADRVGRPHSITPDPGAQGEPGRADPAVGRGETCHDLRLELDALTGLFSEAGRRLADASRDLLDPGMPPPDDLPSIQAACRRDFDAFRARALRVVGTLIDLPAGVEATAGLRDIASLLERAVGVEAERADAEATRRLALDILDRVARLRHRDLPVHPPLAECRAKAKDLADLIATRPATDLPTDAARIAGGGHPFASLLTIIDGQGVPDDGEWTAHYRAVEDAFGRAVAVVAARGKVVTTPG